MMPHVIPAMTNSTAAGKLNVDAFIAISNLIDVRDNRECLLRLVVRQSPHRLACPLAWSPAIECAILLVEEAIEKRRKAGGHVVSGRTDDRQRLLAIPVAQPKESGQLGHVVGMKMAYGDYRQVAKLCSRLAEAKEGPPPVSTRFPPGCRPKDVAR
jgi:hypothetical protein